MDHLRLKARRSPSVLLILALIALGSVLLLAVVLTCG